jgi:ADP-ribose pyrophosphatase
MTDNRVQKNTMKKIPDNAKLVFKGVIFDVYHWQQEMFDGSFATFEALKKRESVTVVAVCDGKILINQEEQPGRTPFVAVPGGMCEKGDDPLATAKRELLEETGYVSDDWQEWFVSDPLNHAKIEWNNYFYIAKNCKKVADQKLDAGEKITSLLISFEEFLEMQHDPKFRNRDLIPILEKAASSKEEKQTLKDLLGITT